MPHTLPPTPYLATLPAKRDRRPQRPDDKGPTIVVVGHDHRPAASRAQALSALAFRVVTAPNTAAVARSPATRPDLFLIEDHQHFALNHRFYWERRIFDGARTIVIGDSHCRETQIQALDLGADDAVAADCSDRELWARIKVVLNLYRPRRASSEAERYIITSVGDFTPGLMTLSLLEGSELPLNRFETALLQRLANTPRSTVSRDNILDALPPDLTEIFDRTVDQGIRRLRRRLADHDLAGLIQTTPSGGYRLDAQVRRA